MADEPNSRPKITKDIIIAELVDHYPDVVEMLVVEYGFHCVQCIVSGYETLEQGAAVHGIEGEELEEMMSDIQAVINE